MGFSVTAAHVIFLTAAVAAASAAGGALFSVQDDTEELERDAWRRHEERTWSNLTLTATQYESGPQRVTLTLENTGTTVLDVTELEYMLDGQLRTDRVTSTTVAGDANTELWLPGETLVTELSPIDTSPGTVRVIAGNGASTYG